MGVLGTANPLFAGQRLKEIEDADPQLPFALHTTIALR
jgi:hypothetical protein